MTASLKIDMQTIQKADETYDVLYTFVIVTTGDAEYTTLPGLSNLAQNASLAV